MKTRKSKKIISFITIFCIVIIISAITFSHFGDGIFKVKINEDYAASDTTITLNWKKVFAADCYRIILKDNESQEPYEVGETDDTSFTIEELNPATNYDFVVQACFKIGEKLAWNNESDQFSAVSSISATKSISSKSTTNSIELNWDVNKYAQGYQIYMFENDKYVELSTISDNKVTKYNVLNLIPNTKYSFKIKSFFELNGTTYYDNSQNDYTIETMSDAVVFTSVIQNNNSVTLNWKEVNGIDGYIVYQKQGNEYIAIDQVSDNKIVSVTVRYNEEKINMFKVIAFYNRNSQITFADSSEEISVDTALNEIKISSTGSTKTTISLNWNKIESAEGYALYLSKNGKYKLVSTINNNQTTYKVEGLNPDTTYDFKIRAFDKLGQINSWGKASESLKVTTQPKYDLSKFKDLWADKPNEIVTPKNKTVYLTFDDGPSDVTIKILDILKEKNVKATFFVCAQVPAQRSQKAINILKRIVTEGHTIGIHTYTHDYNEIYASLGSFLNDFNKMYQFVYKNTGYRASVFRFAGGSNTSYNAECRQEIIQEMTKRGFVYYDWNAANQDAVGKSYSSDQLANFAIKSLKPNYYSIVLMHDLSTKITTIECTRKIIDYGLKNGYTFDKLTNNIKPVQFA